MADDSSSRSHSGRISLTSIPMLEDQPGWEDWIRNAEGWLIDHDYDEAAPTAPARLQTRALDDNADVYLKTLAAWKRGQKKAIAGLKSRCGKRAFGLCKAVETVEDLLEVLKAEFKPKGEGLFNEIYNRWETVNLEDCKDINDYCTQFDQIRTELSDLDPECIFPRPILIKKFLQGLGNAFSTWEMSFYQQHSIVGDDETPGVTLLEAQQGARVEEQRLKGNNATVAMLATNRHGKRPRQAQTSPAEPGGRWCHNTCKHSGHWDRDCWIQHPEMKLIWEAQNPGKAAKRNAGKRARTGKPEGTAPSPPASAPQPALVHAAMAIETRNTNLF
jgi:hypothetical protein